MCTAEESSRARGILMHAGHAQTPAAGGLGRPQAAKGKGVHCKHVQLIFTMFSQPPPRQYNPPLEARTVCQENKRVSRREGETRDGGRLQKVAAQAEERWKSAVQGHPPEKAAAPKVCPHRHGDLWGCRDCNRLLGTRRDGPTSP